MAVGNGKVVIRIFSFNTAELSASFIHGADQRVRYIAELNQKGSINNSCNYVCPISTNSIGIEDNEWTDDSLTKIVLLYPFELIMCFSNVS